jgi:hypothetical protein
MSIGQFFVELGFDVDEQSIETYEERILSAAKTVGSLAKAAVGAASAIGAFVVASAMKLDSLGKFAEVNQVGVEALQEIGHAANLTGSNMDAVKASVSSVNKTIGEAALGVGKGAKLFEQLGLSAKNADGSVKTFDDMLGDVSDKMQGLSRQEQLAIAQKLGIDSSLVPMLARGRDALEAMRLEAREMGAATQEDAEAASALTSALDRVRFMLGSLAIKIAAGLMPVVTGVLDGFNAWMKANKEIIKSSITTAVTVLTRVIGILWSIVRGAVSGLVDFIRFLERFRLATIAAGVAISYLVGAKMVTLIKGFTAAMKLARAAMASLAFNPVVLILGAIAILIALLIDDFMVWQDGGESLIGSLVEQFSWLGDAIEEIKAFVMTLAAFWLAQWDKIKGALGRLIDAVGRLVVTLAQLLWPIIKVVFGFFAKVLGFLIPIILDVVAIIVESFVGVLTNIIDIIGFLATAFEKAFELIGVGVDWLIEKFTGFIDGIKGVIDWASKGIGKVAELLGLKEKAADTPDAAAVTQNGNAPAAGVSSSEPLTGAALAPAAAKNNIFHGAAGAASVSNSTSNTTNITVPQIVVNSPDPAKAGQNVRDELARMNRNTTRNAQSPVGY